VPELRSATRFPIRLPIAVKRGDENAQLTTETADISAGGVMFHFDQEIEVGSQISFRIAMPADILGTPSDVMVSCVGHVVRCGDEQGKKAVAAVIDEYKFERC
jgi:c-di-GMP-binding flagellar brake protein YcgR